MAPPPAQVAEELSGALRGGDAPEWLNCDLVACHVFKEVSAEIVATCRTLGAQLQGHCGQAEKRLPSTADKGATEECLSFLTAFGLLSNALLAVGEDLESAVTQPLQQTLATLQEERSGRLKHWRQVRMRFTELQERYGRSRQRSLDAKDKLASRSRRQVSKAALEQHAATCELAECEEELLESEASLRTLEDESRQRLQQLEQENHVLLRGVLAKGAGSLRRLVPVADKALPPEEGDDKGPAREAFAGVMPIPAPPEANAPQAAQAAAPLAASTDSLVDAFAASVSEEGASKARQGEEEASKQDPSAKYLQGSKVRGGLEISALEEETGTAEDSEPEDVAARAANWTPTMKSGATTAAPRKRTLIFQSTNANLHGKSSLAGSDAAAPRSAPLLGAAVACCAESPAASAKSRAVAGAMPFTLHRMSAFQLEAKGITSTAVTEPEGLPAGLCKSYSAAKLDSEGLSSSTRVAEVKEGGSCSSTACAELPQDRLRAAGVCLGRPEPVPHAKVAKESASFTSAKESANIHVAPAAEDKFREASNTSSKEIDSDEEEELGRSRPKVVPLEKSEMAMEFSPVIAEDPRQCFEQYVARLPERFGGTTECSWSRLQGKASESLLGAHLGKLELFWICTPGAQGSAETALGLVCFQFVQGAASNFARVLHLSVTDGVDYTWQDMLPSAVLEVRHLLFGTLPVDNVRAIMLANEDDSGRILVDRDVEVAYQRCWFRWFQLTQSLRRTSRSTMGLQRRGKKLASRFLVLHTHRDESDPRAPTSSIGRLPALKLREEGTQDSATASPPTPSSTGEAFTTF